MIAQPFQMEVHILNQLSSPDVTKQEIILANRDYLFPSVFHYFREALVISSARDQFVFDADGNQYLDFFGGIVTVSVGHCNQEITGKLHALTPATAKTAAVMEAARENRLLISKGGLWGNVIRISPPLNITTGDVDEFIRRLDKSFEAINGNG